LQAIDCPCAGIHSTALFSRNAAQFATAAAHRFANVIAKTVTGKQKSGRFDGPLRLHLFVNR